MAPEHHDQRRRSWRSRLVGHRHDGSTGLAAPAVAALLLAIALMGAATARTVVAQTRADARATTAAQDAPRPPPDAPVTLVFGGDVHFESWLRDAVRRDPDGALRGLADLLAGADLAVVNLETAVTDRGDPAPKQHTFRAPPEGLEALGAAGVDVVSIANNHGMDFGRQGLADTVDAARRAGVALIGGGLDEAAAYRPHRVTIHGRRVAVFGATQVLDTFAIAEWDAGPGRPGLASAKRERGGLSRLLAAVRRAAATSDTVAVVLHWGQELRQCPLPRQRRLAGQLRAAGADVIVGGHAHRLAAGGFLGDAAVGYGLGNLVFYATDGPATTSGALAVTIAPDDRTTVRWRPAVLREGVATPVDAADRTGALTSWRALRSCSGLTAAPRSG